MGFSPITSCRIPGFRDRRLNRCVQGGPGYLPICDRVAEGILIPSSRKLSTLMDVTPDLLTFDDGSTVTGTNWPSRREELAETIIPHQFGGMPPEPATVDVIRRSISTLRHWPGVRYHTYELRVHLPQDKTISITLSLWIPPGEGPFPVLLDADGCWRYFHDDVVKDVLDRGNIAASVDRTEVAADNPNEYDRTGLYRILDNPEFGVCAAWAWSLHRCVDGLTTIDDADEKQIAITGHSRGGKTVLLAGATDQRIAITNPNNSGIGGAGLHRLKMPGSEVIDDFFGSGNIFWFGQPLAAHRHRDGEVPYDNHFLHAMVAPRGLLLTEAYEDFGANPAGTYVAATAARKVYEVLDRPDAIGWAFRERGHAHYREDYAAVLDFMDQQFHERELTRNFQRSLYPGLTNILESVEGVDGD